MLSLSVCSPSLLVYRPPVIPDHLNLFFTLLFRLDKVLLVLQFSSNSLYLNFHTIPFIYCLYSFFVLDLHFPTSSNLYGPFHHFRKLYLVFLLIHRSHLLTKPSVTFYFVREDPVGENPNTKSNRNTTKH